MAQAGFCRPDISPVRKKGIVQVKRTEFMDAIHHRVTTPGAFILLFFKEESREASWEADLAKE